MERKKPWELPGWEAVSYKSPSDFKPSDPESRNDYQDILSTWDAIDGALTEALLQQEKEKRRVGARRRDRNRRR